MSDVEGPMSASEDSSNRPGSLHDERSEMEVSEEEVSAYANFIGIDIDKEPHLRWIAARGVSAPVPAPWEECVDGDETFYFNKNTNESIWDHPCDSKYKRLVKKYRALGPTGAPAPGKECSECSDSEVPASIVGGSCSGSSSRSSPRSPRSPRVDGGETSNPVDIVGGSWSGNTRSPRSHRRGSDSPASSGSPRSPHADNSKELGTGSPVGFGGARATQCSAGAGRMEDESFASDAPLSRSPSPERRRSSGQRSRCFSPPSRSGNPGFAREAPAPVKNVSDIEKVIPSEPRGDDEARVSPSSKPTLSEKTGASVDVFRLEQSQASARTTLKTWGQLQTEIRALSELLAGVEAMRVKQQEYLQRLISGPQSSMHVG